MSAVEWGDRSRHGASISLQSRSLFPFSHLAKTYKWKEQKLNHGASEATTIGNLETSL